MRKGAKSAVLLALLFLAGLALLLYPLVSSRYNARRSAALIEDYTAAVADTPQEDYSAWFAAADAYNASLTGKDVPDAFAAITDEESANYLAQLAFDPDGVMGYISIPKIAVSLPIYHGTTPATLEKGAGHLEGSALPVGGAGTHCVISAHRGLPSAAMFTDLDRLALGDHFYIYVLDRVLAYEVDQILTVAPDELSALDREPDMDYTTLVTCTPYGVNTHRLLVRGHRVDYVPQTAADEGNSVVRSVHTNYVLWTVVGLLATAAFIALYVSLSRRKAHEPRRPRARRGVYQARH